MGTLNLGRVVRSIAGIAVVGTIMAGCASDSAGDEDPPPEAPQQVLPEPDAEHTDNTEDVAITELADADWVAETAEENAIPLRAMSAYAGAALRIAETQPECNLGWNTLAGIGSVETSHASIDDSGLDAQGGAEPAIIGPVLDGSEEVMEVPDTDQGEYDDDDDWDRAVGPMQFLPETWESYAVDGNQDGQTDPQQIDDAVLTAGTYLCETADDFSDDEQWLQAVTTYNQSTDYARDVARIATSYAAEDNDDQ